MKNLEKFFNLRGKVAAVVGGSGHLCGVLAQAMSDVGMRVATLDLTAPGKAGKHHLKCDVRSPESLRECRDRLLKKYGRIDVLINGAGTNAPTPFLKITPKEIDRILGVHFTGTLHACQLFGETMIRQKEGSIINFTSVSMGPPLSKAFVYSAAKAAVFNLTQNLAREWAPWNIRVNALRPGFFPTEWSRKHFIDKERETRILQHTPMGRFGKPKELVGAVLWLASDAARFVTGSLVTVDGGFTAMTL